MSPFLLRELRRALAYPKIRQRISQTEAAELIQLLEVEARVVDDPTAASSFRSGDPGDDYLLALAASTGATLVSGDAHILRLAAMLPIHSPSAVLDLLDPTS